MPYLKQVTISGNNYYYLFHTIREGEKYKKVSKYLGKEKPSDSDLEKLKADFLAEIKKEPKTAEEKETPPNVVALLLDLQEKKRLPLKRRYDSAFKRDGYSWSKHLWRCHFLFSV